MKSSEIKIGHIYYVDYEPVRNGEFNGKHLSVVLKRNNDKYTFVVMPLTSSANGDGVNKINIGKIATLPSNLHTKDTYAVFDQLRTVNANRFSSVKCDGNSIAVPMDNVLWLELFGIAMRDMVFNLEQNEKISVLKTAYDRECFNKAKNIAFDIIKLRKSGIPETDDVAVLKNAIRETLNNVSCSLDSMPIEDAIKKIFDEALKS